MPERPPITTFNFPVRVYIPRDISIPSIKGQENAALEKLKSILFPGIEQNFTLQFESPAIYVASENVVTIEFDVWFEAFHEIEEERITKLFEDDYFGKIPREWQPKKYKMRQA